MSAPHQLRPTRLTAIQWRSGAAAWLGWLFDGLDMHLYTLVAVPFVAELMSTTIADPSVKANAAWIQAAFLCGWALGGAFFGIIGDRLGRSRTLVLTILTYALFTGLGYFAQTWWQLAGFRFLSALGIGGEWAVGAALLAETWPRAWRPWLAAGLQSAVNIGIMLAAGAGILLAGCAYRTVFLVGLVPALLTLWIRRAVPETAEWQHARQHSRATPGIRALFAPALRRTTCLTLAVCGLTLTAHWAFMFWSLQQLRCLPEVASRSSDERTRLASIGLLVLMVASIVGNFLAAWLARQFGWRKVVAAMALAYGTLMVAGYVVARPLSEMWVVLALIGICQGVFALFTMYLPPLFPTLLRTTGAGFCYNFGRIAAALGTVLFGFCAPLGELRWGLVGAAMLFIPAAWIALRLPEDVA